jgi:murein DD-endopeptidase MepM/ murein hydrolase activator NlpD
MQKERELERIAETFKSFSEESGFIEEPPINQEIAELEELDRNIETGLLQFDEKLQIAEETEQQIATIRSQIGTLSGQLIALEISIDGARKELAVIEEQIERRIARIGDLTEEKDRIAAEKSIQQNTAVELFALLQQENRLNSSSGELQNIVRLLVSSESMSENQWRNQQLQALEATGRKIFFAIERAEAKLVKTGEALNRESSMLSALQSERVAEEKRIAAQITAKNKLRRMAIDNENIYEELLQQSKQEMEQTALQIIELERDKQWLQDTLRELEETEAERRRLLAEKSRNAEITAEQDFAVGEAFLLEDEGEKLFSWPIEPKRGISAYFLDKAYEGVFNTKHYAIDIPAPQGTTIYAPALGYVYKVNDNGMGYSSLVVAHKNNITTVYGHITEFLVEEGDLIRRGDPIALSGGAPGTRGAGWMTTGPHLHFEVHINGEPVNPMPYLPQSILPEAYRQN